ncbi:MAG: anhydro-N-acetylmuramic acid kinase [Ferruginibacter sp.]
MNRFVEKLYSIAGKQKRLVIGLMSGTSLDGLDVVIGYISGNGAGTKFEQLHFETVPYEEDFKKEIKNIFSKKQVNLERLTLLNPWVALYHAKIITELLLKWGIPNSDVDLIASHGQTIYHAPKSLHRNKKFGNATLQIGDGDHLAVATGIITISDFRQKNIAAGGEGAPLALYGDSLLFANDTENRLLLNIGGIANFTYLPADKSELMICTDTGPGNTLMDAFIQKIETGKYFDKDSLLAKQGTVNKHLLDMLLKDSFFALPFPKTTGPELFNLEYLVAAKEMSGTGNISDADCMATLNAFTARSIAVSFLETLSKDANIKVYMSGGGMHNPLLVETLKILLPGMEFYSSDVLGINPDAKEAILFALLANESICGKTTTFTGTGFPAVGMGKISLPG